MKDEKRRFTHIFKHIFKYISLQIFLFLMKFIVFFLWHSFVSGFRILACFALRWTPSLQALGIDPDRFASSFVIMLKPDIFLR